jgi:hypothetical protein
MPSKTISTSDANFARIIAALKDRREGLVGKDGTDAQLYIAWLKRQHVELVFKNERRVAQGAVTPDTGIADIT